MALALPQAAVRLQSEPDGSSVDGSARHSAHDGGGSSSHRARKRSSSRNRDRGAAAENVQTAVRLRPLLPSEGGRGSMVRPVSCVEVGENGRVVLYDPQKPQQMGRAFDCNFAFDSSNSSSEGFADQRHIFDTLGAEMVQNATEGINCCLIAYGQTGTGKTHTVHGDWQDQEQRGILPRLSEGLFQQLETKTAEGCTARVLISYIEVYNNRLRDLFAPPRDEGAKLEIHTHPAVGTYVNNLQELPVQDFKDVSRQVSRGERAKKIARTEMNDRSSRSHTIFSFKVEIKHAAHGHSMSTIQVVDLAGRENEQTTQVKGDRFRELTYINRSLFDLANCVHALNDGSREHVPFRNSKLTMLLSESLSTNSRTTLLATLTPSPTGYEENLLTCRFLESTGRISTIPVPNRFSSEEVRGRLQDELETMRNTLGQIATEDPLYQSRKTLLSQFSRVWGAEDASTEELRAAALIAEATKAQVSALQKDNLRAARVLNGAQATISRLEDANTEASVALDEVQGRLGALRLKLRQIQGQGSSFSTPASTARSARSEGDRDRARASIGLPTLGSAERRGHSERSRRPSAVQADVQVSISLPPIEIL
eukprot:TRINITY_DN47693_c0_g1_i1.p1 TRINITY_DN47693_c0_g1~~TRINITY_DN47693_c0_g1_i1.p1  ORF type:complete len:596 (-),score=108.37 TRINITY_DN47693_c0_g1_i1:31-1818(-)